MSRIVYGVRPVEEALKARRVQALFVADGLEEERGHAARGVLEAAKQHNVHPVAQPRAALDGLCKGGVHQGVVAVAGEYPYASVEEILHASMKSGRAPLIVVLDGVQDPQNLGALVRTCHVAGADGVIIPRDRAVQVTPAVVKASAGATEHTRIALVTNVARTLEELKEGGLWTCGAVASEAPTPWKTDLTVPLALVLGAEGKGIRPLVQKSCDLLVRIPMMGQVASLNVGAAGAMLLYEVTRQRA
ncbi:MAG: 23S rRNA (guanosine(2251)-2'-O)-methyltransferase RlmB [Polyangia bacterium]